MYRSLFAKGRLCLFLKTWKDFETPGCCPGNLVFLDRDEEKALVKIDGPEGVK